MEQMVLDIVIKKELELKRMKISHSLIIKNLQRWGTQHYMFRFCHPSLQIFDNKRMPYFHPFQLQFLFGNNLNNLQHYLLQLKIVIEEELELKKMNTRHSFIIKNLQEWGTLMECLQLQNVIEMELE